MARLFGCFYTKTIDTENFWSRIPVLGFSRSSAICKENDGLLYSGGNATDLLERRRKSAVPSLTVGGNRWEQAVGLYLLGQNDAVW